MGVITPRTMTMRARTSTGSRSEGVGRWALGSGDSDGADISPNAQRPTPNAEHVPVMLEEVLEALDTRPGGLYLDATVGLGGHAGAVLERLAPDGWLLGLDQDEAAVEIARERLEELAGRH